MTVYVDNFRTPATVGRIRGRWSHLTADTVEELQAFAARLGHRPEWFQARCKHAKCPTFDGVCVHFHYDVVDAKRAEAIALGAVAIDIREMGALISVRRRQFAPEPGLDMPEPCQPIGCDNGHQPARLLLRVRGLLRGVRPVTDVPAHLLPHRTPAQLLVIARQSLAEAAGQPDGLRYATAHLAALRAAAAILAARATPTRQRRSPVRSVWALMSTVAPEFTDWAAYFSGSATTRAAVEAGIPRVVSTREADDMLRAAEQFVAVVEASLGVAR